jgi:cytochrome oxidase Cu insertion factor (SCO1/SenC/PrrC family)
MPGMNSGLNVDDPTVVAAFKLALLHQGLVALLLFVLVIIAWAAIREFSPASAARPARQAEAPCPEPPARRLLRISFGVLWILDGILQAQPGMPVGLPSQVIEPAAQGSPAWVLHLINWAGTSWSYHPIQAAAGAVWIQIGIGIWLLLASKGRLAQLAGIASVGWGLVVWVFGEAFGGIFAPGLSWLTGAPGSVLCYCVAGGLIAMPIRYWQTHRAGRLLVGGFGVFMAGMAVLQAWPGRGFWQGSINGQPGSLTAMVQSMAAQPQPAWLDHLLTGFGSLTRDHGFAVNLVSVLVMAGIGLAFLTGRARIIRPALIVLIIFGLADWIFVQDLGILGGLGTDPNSAIPMILLAVAGYQTLTRRPTPAAVSEVGDEAATAGTPGTAPATRRLRPAALLSAVGGAGLLSVTSAAAVGLVLLGAIPLAAAQADASASPILAESVDGSSAPLNSAAPGFALTDQSGKPVSLGSLHGKVVLLTFLDPVCVTDCPLIAQEFREAGLELAGQRSRVALVAVNLNPLYRAVSYLRAFDQEERLTGIPNWLYLTGSPAQLERVWRDYGIYSQTLPAGSMLGHSDAAYVIGPDGRLEQELDFDPGPGTDATVSSFATELTDAAQRALSQS